MTAVWSPEAFLIPRWFLCWLAGRRLCGLSLASHLRYARERIRRCEQACHCPMADNEDVRFSFRFTVHFIRRGAKASGVDVDESTGRFLAMFFLFSFLFLRKQLFWEMTAIVVAPPPPSLRAAGGRASPHNKEQQKSRLLPRTRERRLWLKVPGAIIDGNEPLFWKPSCPGTDRFPEGEEEKSKKALTSLQMARRVKKGGTFWLFSALSSSLRGLHTSPYQGAQKCGNIFINFV